MRKNAHLLATVVLLTATFTMAQATRPAVSALINKLPSARFEWLADPGVSDRASMNVPIELGGRSLNFQLDTGADVTILYGTEEAQKWGWKTGQRSVKVTDIRLGGSKLPSAWCKVDPENHNKDSSGTVGLDQLIGHVVVIDFPGKRFAVMPRADVPWEIFDRTSFAPGEL